MVSIPVCDSCNCKLHFEYKDIVEHGIIPVIESIVSAITCAIADLDIFGLYAIEHFFVLFNYFTSIFHRSYEGILKYNLRRTTDISLAIKRLRMPYTLFSEPGGAIIKSLIKEKFILVDGFSFGNLLQTSGENYKFKLTPFHNFDTTPFDCKVHNDRYDNENCFIKRVE
jgi:hypothetical protein